MELNKIIVTVLGTGVIGFIWWFFFGRRNEEPNAGHSFKDNKGAENLYITVEGGYKPAVLFLKKGVETTLNIIRKDASTCLSDIIIPDFKLSSYLPLNKQVQMTISPEKSGEYPFHCGMNMYHGKIIVE